MAEVKRSFPACGVLEKEVVVPPLVFVVPAMSRSPCCVQFAELKSPAGRDQRDFS